MFSVPRSMESTFDPTADISSSDLSELMYGHTNNNRPSWGNELTVPRGSSGRGSHHRESSLTSTLGSTEPNSPCSPNMPTPQVAVTDPSDDVYRDGMGGNSWNYHLTTDAMGSQHDQQFLYNDPPLYGLHHANNNVSKMSYPMGTVLIEPPLGSGNPTSSARPMPGSSRNSEHANPPSYRNRSNDNRQRAPAVPKLDRTMTDVYDDGLYSPNLDITSSARPNPSPAHLPGGDVFSQRLHDARSLARDPTRGDGTGSHSSPIMNRPMSASLSYGGLQIPEDRVLRNARATDTPQTISPQDSMLDFSETDCGSGLPLFPPHETGGFAGLDYLTDDDMSQGGSTHGRKPADVQIAKGFQYMPSMASSGMYGTTGFPIYGPQQGDHQSMASGSSLGGSMAPMAGASQALGGNEEGGTYSCTYHGCTLRFDTPALLQKHKREGHRQAGAMKSSQRGPKSNAADTQAGPHRCYRVNPGTGKVCKAVFSRPYDLTRHEDTIHNARKQKVRCDLCAEEKLFSRADALTRHYRVCHPEVELPGKHKRRRLAGQS